MKEFWTPDQQHNYVEYFSELWDVPEFLFPEIIT